jgi:hypothetical protein
MRPGQEAPRPGRALHRPSRPTGRSCTPRPGPGPIPIPIHGARTSAISGRARNGRAGAARRSSRARSAMARPRRKVDEHPNPMVNQERREMWIGKPNLPIDGAYTDLRSRPPRDPPPQTPSRRLVSGQARGHVSCRSGLACRARSGFRTCLAPRGSATTLEWVAVAVDAAAGPRARSSGADGRRRANRGR